MKRIRKRSSGRTDAERARIVAVVIGVALVLLLYLLGALGYYIHVHF